jgi:hypothetical protein
MNSMFGMRYELKVAALDALRNRKRMAGAVASGGGAGGGNGDQKPPPAVDGEAGKPGAPGSGQGAGQPFTPTQYVYRRTHGDELPELARLFGPPNLPEIARRTVGDKLAELAMRTQLTEGIEDLKQATALLKERLGDRLELRPKPNAGEYSPDTASLEKELASLEIELKQLSDNGLSLVAQLSRLAGDEASVEVPPPSVSKFEHPAEDGPNLEEWLSKWRSKLTEAEDIRILAERLVSPTKGLTGLWETLQRAQQFAGAIKKLGEEADGLRRTLAELTGAPNRNSLREADGKLVTFYDSMNALRRELDTPPLLPERVRDSYLKAIESFFPVVGAIIEGLDGVAARLP